MVAMPAYLAEKMRARCEAVGSGYLFRLTPSQVLYRFKKLLRNNGLPPYTVHALRHYFVAYAHSLGIPDK